VLTKYLTEEAHARIVKKEEVVEPNSPLFMYLNTLQELEKTKQEKQTMQNQLNEILTGVPQMETKIQQVDLPRGGNK